MVDLVVRRTDELSDERLVEIRALMDAAFKGDFSEEDWAHTIGGLHVLPVDGPVVVHAAVVERRIDVGTVTYRCGYVEGVATAPERQGKGLGSAAMAVVNDAIRTTFRLGLLSTDRHSFYERAGWSRWEGPTYVRTDTDFVRTPDEDDGIMALRFGLSEHVDLSQPIACEPRDGDDW